MLLGWAERYKRQLFVRLLWSLPFLLILGGLISNMGTTEKHGVLQNIRVYCASLSPLSNFYYGSAGTTLLAF